MTRTMALLAVSLLVSAPSSSAENPLAPLAFLAGNCWQGEFADGGSWDKHCFEWAYDGRFLRDRHVVTGKRAPYSGESMYRFDGQRIVFHYFSSAGGYSEGIVESGEKELRFPEERYTQGGKELKLRTVWKIVSETNYVAITEQLRDGKWQEAWRVDFKRI